MVALFIIGGVLLGVVGFLVVAVCKLCWYSVPWDEWVRYQRMVARERLHKQDRKKRRCEKWKQLRKKYLFFWRS